MIYGRRHDGYKLTNICWRDVCVGNRRGRHLQGKSAAVRYLSVRSPLRSVLYIEWGACPKATADIVQDQPSADLDAHLIQLENISRVQIALHLVTQSSSWLCCRTRLGFRMLQNAFDKSAQTIQNSRLVGAQDIDWHEMFLIETGRTNKFLEEFLLGLRSAAPTSR